MSLVPTIVEPAENINPIESDDIDIVDNPLVESDSDYIRLSKTEKLYVNEVVKEFISGDIKTDTELIEILGIPNPSLYRIKARGRASRVIANILPQLAKIHSPEVLNRIRKAIDEDWRAGKFYLEFTGQYIQRSQQAVLHANMNQGLDNITSPGQLMERIVTQFASLGYDEERFVTEFRGKWNELKANGQI